MALSYLLLDKATQHIRKVKETDFPANYYDMPEWEIVTIGMSLEQIESYKVPLSDNGELFSSENFKMHWYCAEDQKTYVLKERKNHELRYDNGNIVNTIAENPVNKEEEVL